MNEATSIFMTMIESTINKMIDARIEAKRDETLQTLWDEVRSLNDRFEKLEADLGSRTVQIECIETDLKAVQEKVGSVMNCQDNDQMDNAKRIEALEQKQGTTLGVAVMDLQSTEFLEAVCKIIDKHTMGDEFLNPLVTALIDNGEFVDAINEAAKDVARSEAEEAISDHCSDYDHDDIHESGEIDSDAVREVIEEVLNNVTVSLKI